MAILYQFRRKSSAHTLYQALLRKIHAKLQKKNNKTWLSERLTSFHFFKLKTWFLVSNGSFSRIILRTFYCETIIRQTLCLKSKIYFKVYAYLKLKLLRSHQHQDHYISPLLETLVIAVMGLHIFGCKTAFHVIQTNISIIRDIYQLLQKSLPVGETFSPIGSIGAINKENGNFFADSSVVYFFVLQTVVETYLLTSANTYFYLQKLLFPLVETFMLSLRKTVICPLAEKLFYS